MTNIYTVTERDSFSARVLTYHLSYSEALQAIDALCNGIETIYHEETNRWYHREQYTEVHWNEVMAQMEHEQNVRFGGKCAGGYLLKSYFITRVMAG